MSWTPRRRPPPMVRELLRHGLAEQFRYASEELRREEREDALRLVALSTDLGENK